MDMPFACIHILQGSWIKTDVFQMIFQVNPVNHMSRNACKTLYGIVFILLQSLQSNY
jgi:hypothetical protein